MIVLNIDPPHRAQLLLARDRTVGAATPRHAGAEVPRQEAGRRVFTHQAPGNWGRAAVRSSNDSPARRACTTGALPRCGPLGRQPHHGPVSLTGTGEDGW